MATPSDRPALLSSHAQINSNSSSNSTEPAALAAKPDTDHRLKRSLGCRQVHLVAVGGSIGTALFVSIGGALQLAGPGSLLLAFIFYSIVLTLCNNCTAEMVVYMPVSGGFVRLAGKWVDDAFGFMAGWNFFFYQAFLIPFEIVALTVVLSYWTDAAWLQVTVCGVCIILYALLNLLAVGVYGNAEFYLSSGKILLLVMLFSFTIFTMAGANPQHDSYGFRAWSAGAFAEYLRTGALGKFEGFLTALWAAAFTCVGPEYVSVMVAEAKHPRTYVKQAYKIVFWRIWIFFVGSALAVGIVVSHKDPTLTAIYTGEGASAGSAAASPYIIAMDNLGIHYLPHIMTSLLVTTIFSAGNSCTYTSTRVLHSLALEGRAPKFLIRTTNKGAPIYALLVVMIFPCFAFMQMSSSSRMVLEWLIKLTTTSTIIDYIVICITYICFYRACKAQHFHRSRLPYVGWFQPYSAYIGLVCMTLILLGSGYTSLKPFDAAAFFIHYSMVFLALALFLFWKLFKKTELLGPLHTDLVWAAPKITEEEETLSLTEPPVGFMRDIYNYFRINKILRRKSTDTPTA